MAAIFCYLPVPAVARENRRLASRPEGSSSSASSNSRRDLPLIDGPVKSRFFIKSSFPRRGALTLAARATPNDEESTPSGPPPLTIVAGVAVFLLVCWGVGSAALWLVGLLAALFFPK